MSFLKGGLNMSKTLKNFLGDNIYDIYDIFKSTDDIRLHERCHVLILLDKGYTQEEVANICEVTDRTIRNWLDLYRRGGVEMLRPSFCPNPVRKIDCDEIRYKILDVLRNSPEDYGYNVNTWRPKSLRDYIKKEFDITVTEDGVRKFMRKYKYRVKRGRYVPIQKNVDDEELKRVRLEIYDYLTEGYSIYYIDETICKMNDVFGYVWAKIGEKVEIPRLLNHETIPLFGSVNITDKNITYMESSVLNTKSFIKFLEQILSQDDSNPIVIVLDNASYHKSLELVIWNFINELNSSRRIVFKYLPPYCPEENIVEWLWRELKTKVTRSRLFKSTIQLRKAVIGFFEDWSNYFDINAIVTRVIPEIS